MILTLQQPEQVAGFRQDDAKIPVTPMACESFVSHAMRHLLSGFLIVENLSAKSRSVCGSLELGLTSESICTVLRELNDCSVGFWRLPQARIPAVARLRELGGPLKRRHGLPDGKCRHEAAASHAVETKPRQPFAPEFVSQGPVPNSEPEWGQSLALAILHLVGAYRAMDILSASAFPSGAPDSFDLACHCLCTALLTLDACLTWSVD